jgi:hypothetical protein
MILFLAEMIIHLVISGIDILIRRERTGHIQLSNMLISGASNHWGFLGLERRTFTNVPAND